MSRFYVECTYCGIAANGLDHIIPVLYNNISRKSASYSKHLVVPCCNECNNKLSSFYLPSIAERAEYILEAYKLKYKKILNRPDWTEDELQEMGENMRKTIKNNAVLKINLNQRLSYLLDVSLNKSLTPLDVWDKYSDDVYIKFAKTTQTTERTLEAPSRRS